MSSGSRYAIVLSVVALLAAGCAVEPSTTGDTSQENGNTDDVSVDEADLTCGSLTGTVGSYTTKCACGVYSLPCLATQSVGFGYVCNLSGLRCWSYKDRTVQWSSSTSYTALTNWQYHQTSCVASILC